MEGAEDEEKEAVEKGKRRKDKLVVWRTRTRNWRKVEKERPLFVRGGERRGGKRKEVGGRC